MTLCFIADENIETEIVAVLREMGYETTKVSDLTPGAEDDEILQEAQHHGCILITNDKDFGELVFRQKRATAGVMLIRMPGLAGAKKAELVKRALEEQPIGLHGSFVVLSPQVIRIRAALQ